MTGTHPRWLCICSGLPGPSRPAREIPGLETALGAWGEACCCWRVVCFKLHLYGTARCCRYVVLQLRSRHCVLSTVCCTKGCVWVMPVRLNRASSNMFYHVLGSVVSATVMCAGGSEEELTRNCEHFRAKVVAKYKAKLAAQARAQNLQVRTGTFFQQPFPAR